VVVYNAHFAERYGAAPLPERNEQCIAAFKSMPFAASTIFFVQEAGTYLWELAKRAFTTHRVFYQPTDGRMALLTLVPIALLKEEGHASGGAYVTMHELRNSAMARQFHAVHVRDMVLVNTHLESCASSRDVRSRQVDEINAMYGGGEYRLGIFGDLNGYQNHWDSPIPGGTAVSVLEKQRYPSISPHKLLVLSVE
jgi:hypothetical protein